MNILKNVKRKPLADHYAILNSAWKASKIDIHSNHCCVLCFSTNDIDSKWHMQITHIPIPANLIYLFLHFHEIIPQLLSQLGSKEIQCWD